MSGEDRHAGMEKPDAGQSPGTRLQAAREAQGLSREDVAQRIHLSEAQISDLEEDRFDRFPAPIFVSGYLRKYAVLLGLPPEPLVQAYEGRGVEPPPLHTELTSAAPRPKRVRVEYWAAALVGAGLVALVLTWLLSGAGEAPPPSSPPPLAQSAPALAAVPSEERAPPAASPAPAPPARPQPVAGETTVPPQAQENPRQLGLHFSADSWVEIADADGRRLMFGLGKGGQVRTLEGRPPFSVLLGYAPGVEIEYNGKPYDFRRHIRNKVARFQLD